MNSLCCGDRQIYSLVGHSVPDPVQAVHQEKLIGCDPAVRAATCGVSLRAGVSERPSTSGRANP